MSWQFLVGMIVGAWIGCFFGILVVCLCKAATEE